jgi:hypothetical protein
MGQLENATRSIRPRKSNRRPPAHRQTLGVDYWLWWNTKDGSVSHGANGSGKGGTWGCHASAGLAVSLDGLDPRATEGTRGIFAHVHAFGEAMLNFANGFGQAYRLDASDNVIWVGVSVDLR